MQATITRMSILSGDEVTNYDKRIRKEKKKKAFVVGRPLQKVVGPLYE